MPSLFLCAHLWYNGRMLSSLRRKNYFVILVGIAKNYSF